MKSSDFTLTAIIDTREQIPLDLEKHGIKTIRDTLPFGDYSLIFPNLKNYLTIERKSLPDFIGCVGKERKRFEKELLALRGFSRKMVICEFNLADVFEHRYRSKTHVSAVMGSLGKWEAWGINFIMAGNHEIATWFVAKYLNAVAKEFFEFANLKIQKNKNDY